MSKINSGGNAFPVVCEDHSKTQTFEAGMTLRDYFAAKALQGLLACPETSGIYSGFAEKAYKCADAMIVARDGIPSHAICYFSDGDKTCCVFGDFINLQESPAGFGSTTTEALADLQSKTSKGKR